ncbi:MAG: hypothetical protein LBH19_01070 [Dysgonamonadaceae bacterium]|jgi:hypothetical protein|nr:hypothetical protein [Dysgonamonadaceae bacterium]
MERIIHRELLEIFSHTETAGDDAKDTTLGEFADELTDYCRKEEDLAQRTRTLRFARSELVIAQGRIHTGEEKNAPLQDKHSVWFIFCMILFGIFQSNNLVSFSS